MLVPWPSPMDLERLQPRQPPLFDRVESVPGRVQQLTITRAIAHATAAIMNVHNRDIAVDHRREIQQAWELN
eukprot:7569523-Pyramimonas_sp.AAC.1